MPMRADSNPLYQVFERRWAVPILAELADTHGCKLVTLNARLDGSRASIKASLDLLAVLGLVLPNEGYGHPMRPEYVLSDRGVQVCKPASALVRALVREDSFDTGFKKWSMPTVHAISRGADRFGVIVSQLNSATDRAVSLALNDLDACSLVERSLVDGRPPHNAYRLTRFSRRLSPMLADLSTGLNKH
jgi:DNA-binding HxlR family transcriptional regulator